MSILVSELRSIIFTNLRGDLPKELRKAIWNVYNAVDNDLEVIGYVLDNCSSTTQEAIEKLEKVLEIGKDLPEDFEIEVEDDNIPEKLDVLELEIDDNQS